MVPMFSVVMENILPQIANRLFANGLRCWQVPNSHSKNKHRESEKICGHLKRISGVDISLVLATRLT
jgi:hypothetical protein